MADVAELQKLLARAKQLQQALLPRHERDIPFCPHKPHPAQRAFLALEDRFALYGGAAGGGKSDALLMAALMYVDVPGYSALILRKTFSDLNLPGAIMDRAREWLTGSQAKWNAADKFWTFPSGAKLTFGFCENDNDVERYKSAEFQYVGIDEVTDWNKKPALYIASRLRRLKDVDIPVRWRAATNPTGRGHLWVKDAFVTGKAKLGPFVPALLADNPSLDAEDYKLSLGALDDEEQDALLRGLWVQGKKGRVYRFAREHNVVDALPAKTGWRVVVGIDLGSSESTPTTAFVILLVHPHDRRTYVVRSWAVADMAPSDFADVCKKIQDEFGDCRFVMDEGALGAGYGRELRRRHGLPVIPAAKRDKNGYRRLLNGAFKQSEVVLLAGANDDLETELETLLWDKHGLDSQPGMPDHLSDALLYAWRDTRADLATDEPPPAPEIGTEAWHVARLKEAEDAAYDRERQRLEEISREPWRNW